MHQHKQTDTKSSDTRIVHLSGESYTDGFIKLIRWLKDLEQKMSGMKTPMPRRIAAKTGSSYTLVPEDQIMYCQARGNYTQIHLCDGSHLLLTKCLKAIEREVSDHRFCRSHQSYLVNISYVRKIFLQDYKLVLEGDIHIPLSRARKDSVKKRLIR